MMIVRSNKLYSIVVELVIYLILSFGLVVGVTCYLSSLNSMWDYQCLLTNIYVHPLFIYALLVISVMFFTRYRQTTQERSSFKTYLMASMIGVLLLFVIVVFGSILIGSQTLNDWTGFFSEWGGVVSILVILACVALVITSIGLLYLSRILSDTLLKTEPTKAL